MVTMTIPDPEPVKLHINDFRMLAAEAFSVEHSLLVDKQLEDVDRFLVGLVSTIKLATFFEARSIAWLTTTVFENIPVRDFVLAMDARFWLLTSEDDTEESVRLARKLSNVCFFNTQTQPGSTGAVTSLIPSHVITGYPRGNASAARKGNILMLHADRWLMTIMLLFMNYSDAASAAKGQAAPPTSGKGRTTAAMPQAATGQPLAGVTSTQR